MTTSAILDKVRDKKPRSTIIRLSESSAISRVTQFISTGCPPLDLTMGGGVPVGRITEIFGDTSTGKTLLAQHILANTQAMGGVAVLIDTETAIDAELAELIGIDLDDLIYDTPDTIEAVWDTMEQLVSAKEELCPDKPMTIVWDSIAATSSEEEMTKVREQGLGAHTVATHARLLSKMCRCMNTLVARSGIALVLINQTRQKIGVMFGSSVTTFGGKAVGFYSTVRLQLSTAGKIKDKGQEIGINARATVVKNKMAPPFGKIVLPIYFDAGIDGVEAVLLHLKDIGVVTTAGGWYTLPLEDDDVRFQRPGWPKVYVENEEEVLSLLWHGYEEEEEE